MLPMFKSMARFRSEPMRDIYRLAIHLVHFKIYKTAK